ncbi:hypothetical protein ES703_73711 [subsurface metagenome]
MKYRGLPRLTQRLRALPGRIRSGVTTTVKPSRPAQRPGAPPKRQRSATISTARVAEDTRLRATICLAIATRRVIRFYYHGGFRVVEPYRYGVILSDAILRCYQFDGYGEFDDPVGWKLFRASEIHDLTLADEHFTGDRPRYHPNQSLMDPVYCQVSTDTPDKADQTEPQKAKKLFTRGYIRLIKLARKLNQNQKISGDIYFHPTEKRIVVKSIDLTLPATLTEVNSRPRARSDEADRQYREERWLEAYLIHQAKANRWKLRLPRREHGFLLTQLRLGTDPDKEYRFLSSQLKFRKDPARGETQGKTLNLLLYDEEKQYLVLLELKARADTTILNTARTDMDDYAARLGEMVATDDIAEAFDLAEIKGIAAYLVWPRTDASYDSGKFGLLEFDRLDNPWNRYREEGRGLEVRFTNKKESLNLLKT